MDLDENVQDPVPVMMPQLKYNTSHVLVASLCI
jgi:hypothetical protein